LFLLKPIFARTLHGFGIMGHPNQRTMKRPTQ
jgi:hypothetical protein